MNKYERLNAVLANGKIVCAKIKTSLGFPCPITEKSELSQSFSLAEDGKCRLFATNTAGKRARTKTVHADAAEAEALLKELHEYFCTPHENAGRGREWKVVLIDDRGKKHNFKGIVACGEGRLADFSARIRALAGIEGVALFDGIKR